MYYIIEMRRFRQTSFDTFPRSSKVNYGNSGTKVTAGDERGNESDEARGRRTGGSCPHSRLRVSFVVNRRRPSDVAPRSSVFDSSRVHNSTYLDEIKLR